MTAPRRNYYADLSPQLVDQLDPEAWGSGHVIARVAALGRCETCGYTHGRCHGHRDKDGRPCRRPAIEGAVVCTTHGARAPQVAASASKRVRRERGMAEFRRMVVAEGITTEGRTTVDALDELKLRAEERVARWGKIYADLPDFADAIVEIVYDKKEAPHVAVQVTEPGLIGPNHAGNLVAHPADDKYQAAIDLSTRIEKVAADLGLAERRAKLDEEREGLTIAWIKMGLARLDVEWTPETAAVFAEVARELDAIATTGRAVDDPDDGAAGALVPA